MVPAGNKAKCLSSVNHKTKTIHHHHHQPPCDAPRRMRWVPSGWKPEPVNTNIQESKPFEDIFWDKLKGPTNTNKLRGKRLNLRATVVLQVSFLEKKNREQKKVAIKSKSKPPPKKLKPAAKPKYWENSVSESEHFDVLDSEDDIISEGDNKSSIDDNELPSCSKDLSGSEFIVESTCMVKQTL